MVDLTIKHDEEEGFEHESWVKKHLDQIMTEALLWQPVSNQTGYIG